MTIATFGAFYLGETIEAVGVMLFYKVGEYFQESAVKSSRKSIEKLWILSLNLQILEMTKMKLFKFLLKN